MKCCHYWLINWDNQGRCKWCKAKKDFAKLQAKENFTKKIRFGFIPDFLETVREDTLRTYTIKGIR